MQCVSAIAQRGVRSRDILQLRRDTFIDHWQPMKESLFMAIDFIRAELRVPVSQLVPYPASSFRSPISSTRPKSKTHDRTGSSSRAVFLLGRLTSRYSSAAETKIGEDFNKMDDIIAGKAPPTRRRS